MATINGLGTNVSAAVPFETFGSLFILKNTVDFDALGAANGDVVQVLAVPAGTRVIAVESEIVTPSNAATSATMDIGDSADSDGYDAAVSLKASAGTIAVTGSSDAYFFPGRRYTSTGIITATLTYSGATTVKGKVTFRAICIKM